MSGTDGRAFGSLVPAEEGMSREEDAGVAPESEENEGGEIRVGENGIPNEIALCLARKVTPIPSEVWKIVYFLIRI